MPRAKRSFAEVESVKDQILQEALRLMNQHGFEGFSMRKLAKNLGVSAKTIYNYFKNKDDLYLAILTNGFVKLHERFEHANMQGRTAMDRLEKMGREYLKFGIEHAHLYNLMFTWHVPKFKDYIGTPLEPTARRELEAALKVSELFVKTIQDASPKESPLADDEARFHMIWMWSQMHGFIAGLNNTLLEYIHEKPNLLKEKLLMHTIDRFKSDIGKRQIAAKDAPAF